MYDSPLKLEDEMRYCFTRGIHMNFDNLEEVCGVWQECDSRWRRGISSTARFRRRVLS